MDGDRLTPLITRTLSSKDPSTVLLGKHSPHTAQRENHWGDTSFSLLLLFSIVSLFSFMFFGITTSFPLYHVPSPFFANVLNPATLFMQCIPPYHYISSYHPIFGTVTSQTRMPFKNCVYDKQGSNRHFMCLTCISFSNHHFQLIVSVLLMCICMCMSYKYHVSHDVGFL